MEASSTRACYDPAPRSHALTHKSPSHTHCAPGRPADRDAAVHRGHSPRPPAGGQTDGHTRTHKRSQDFRWAMRTTEGRKAGCMQGGPTVSRGTAGTSLKRANPGGQYSPSRAETGGDGCGDPRLLPSQSTDMPAGPPCPAAMGGDTGYSPYSVYNDKAALLANTLNAHLRWVSSPRRGGFSHCHLPCGPVPRPWGWGGRPAPRPPRLHEDKSSYLPLLALGARPPTPKLTKGPWGGEQVHIQARKPSPGVKVKGKLCKKTPECARWEIKTHCQMQRKQRKAGSGERAGEGEGARPPFALWRHQPWFLLEGGPLPALPPVVHAQPTVPLSPLQVPCPMNLRAFAQAIPALSGVTFLGHLSSTKRASLRSYRVARNLPLSKSRLNLPSWSLHLVSPPNHKSPQHLPTTRSPCFTPIFLIAAANKATCCLNSSKVTFTISSLPSPGKRTGTHSGDEPNRKVPSRRLV